MEDIGKNEQEEVRIVGDNYWKADEPRNRIGKTGPVVIVT